MSLFRPIKRADVAQQPLQLWETGVAFKEFHPTYQSRRKPAPSRQRFPRNWTELEALVEARLAQFEQRHQSECEQAFERGVQEGIRRQDQAAACKLSAAQDTLASLAEAVNAQLAEFRASICDQVTRLTAALAETWLRQQVAINPGVFLPALRDALELLAHLDDITVRLNPVDYRSLSDGIAAGEEDYLEYSNLRIIPDPEVAVGGAVAESAGGTVDCRLDTRIKQALQIIAPDYGSD